MIEYVPYSTSTVPEFSEFVFQAGFQSCKRHDLFHELGVFHNLPGLGEELVELGVGVA